MLCEYFSIYNTFSKFLLRWLTLIMTDSLLSPSHIINFPILFLQSHLIFTIFSFIDELGALEFVASCFLQFQHLSFQKILVKTDLISVFRASGHLPSRNISAKTPRTKVNSFFRTVGLFNYHQLDID